MRLRAIAGILLRQYYLLRGSPIRFVPILSWVLMDIVLWGFIARYLNSTGSGKIDFVPQMLGAVLFWDFFERIMQGVVVAFLEDVWSRNFLNLFTSRLLISEYVSGLVLTSIGTSALGLAAMLLLATTVFGLKLFGFATVVPLLLVLFLFGIALGILASAIVLRFGPASEWIIWPLPALLAPFAGVFYPITTLPAWMQAVAAALPPSYVFEALRSAVAGHSVAAISILWPAILALVQVVLAAAVFSFVYRRVVRSGLLARYSAEGAG